MQNSNQTNGQEPEFQVEGSIVYLTNIRGSERAHSQPFTVARKGRQWKIRTTNLNDADPDHWEMSSDGLRIYELHQFDENALRQKHGDLGDRYTAWGWVRHGSFPVGFDLELIYPLWLAYCSSDYFASLKDNRIVSPAWLLDNHCPTQPPVPSNLPLPAKWKFNDSSFVSEIQWYSEGKELMLDWEAVDARVKLVTYPPPYDAGFVYASFETTDWIDYSQLRLPRSFALKTFSPNLAADPIYGEFILVYTVDAKVDTIQRLKNFSCLPELARKTLITDSRFPENPGSKRPLYYGSSSGWLTGEEIEAKLKSKETWHRI
jgi:hypothetical protein